MTENKAADTAVNECMLVFCQSGKAASVTVNENIEDGSFATDICEECAKVIGIEPGADLPEDTNKLIQAHYKLKANWKVGDAVGDKLGTAGLGPAGQKRGRKPAAKKKAPARKKQAAAKPQNPKQKTKKTGSGKKAPASKKQAANKEPDTKD